MNKDSKKKWRTYGMNTTRRDESKKKFYAEVKDILKKKPVSYTHLTLPTTERV